MAYVYEEYRDLVVLERVEEADGVVAIRLGAPSGERLPMWEPGAHIDVQLENGVERQYSLCSHFHADTWRIAVLREPNSRGGSSWIHDHVKAGDMVRTRGPRNHFPLVDAPSYVFIAGGIGVTPILCMAERLAVTGADFEMHYCTRSRSRTAFHERIRASGFAGRVHFHFDDGDAAQRLDLAALLAAPAPGAHLYVCGPKGFMDAVLGSARAGGWPEASLHVEYFNAEVTSHDADAPFEVQLASSGRVVVVPRERTVVQALADAGVEVPTSCEQGVCGTCLTRVLSGVPDHRDLYLTPDEQAANDQFTPCCSRAKTPRLVLDL